MRFLYGRRTAKRERDSSGTTERVNAKHETREGDGADSPTRAGLTSAEGTPCPAKRLAQRKQNFNAS
jgi:hypothetical protein